MSGNSAMESNMPHLSEAESKAIEAQIISYIKSGEASKLIETKFFEYEIARKTQSLIKDYLSWRFVPIVVFLVSLLAFFGFQWQGVVDKYWTEVEKVATLSRDVEASRDQVGKLLVNLELSASKATDQSLEELRNLSEAREKLTKARVGMATDVATAQAKVNEGSSQIQNLGKSVKELTEALARATKDAETLKRKLELQATLINTAILAIVSVDDGARSETIDLPHLDKSSSTLAFTAKKITTDRKNSNNSPPYVDLEIRLDDDVYPSRIERTSGEDWRMWRNLPGKGANYEYRIAHVYHDEKANDFVTIHVRARKQFVESLMRPGDGPGVP